MTFSVYPYLGKQEKEDWESLPKFNATPPDLDAFKEALFWDYPNTREPLNIITSVILDTFIEEKSQQPIHSLAEFATYNWEFRRITGWLVREGCTNPDKLRGAYTKSIHCSLHRKIEIYLNVEKVVPPVIGEPCSIENVRAVAEYVLKGSDPHFDDVVVVHQLEYSKALPSPMPLLVKSENMELLNMINMLGQNFQAALKSVTRPVQQNFLSGNFPSSSANFPRQDHPRPGSAGNRCFICHETSHFLNQCNILSQYIANGKLARGLNNMITLGTGEHLPPNPHNCPWMVLADEYYSRNPQLLPTLLQPGQHDPPPHAQANFTANLVQVSHPECTREEDRPSAILLHVATVTEVTDEDDLVGLGSLTDDLEPDDMDSLGPAYINWLVGVLQTRAKDIRSSKKQDAGKQTQLRLTSQKKINQCNHLSQCK